MSDLITPTSAGFSLVEVMVSLVLVSLTGLAGLTLVDSLTNVQLRVDERYQRLETLQAFWRTVQNDLEQASPSTLTLSTDKIVLSSRTCGRAAIISYTWTDEEMTRGTPTCFEHTTRLDIAQAPKVTILDAAGNRFAAWPPAGIDTSPAPIAIQIEISLPALGETDGLSILRVFELPGTPP